MMNEYSAGDKKFAIIIGVFGVFSLAILYLLPKFVDITPSGMTYLAIFAAISLMCLSFSFGMLWMKLSPALRYFIPLIWVILTLLGLTKGIAVIINKGANHILGVSISILMMVILIVIPYYAGRKVSTKYV